jgi:hypothetical protein
MCLRLMPWDSALSPTHSERIRASMPGLRRRFRRTSSEDFPNLGNISDGFFTDLGAIPEIDYIPETAKQPPVKGDADNQNLFVLD